jgi:chemotaxis regulatin CheY-phosphate phosphatase CheZ
MTTFTIDTEDQHAEKAIKAFLDALELKYAVKHTDTSNKTLDKKSQKLYNGLKSSLQDIKKWENGEIELKDAKDLLNEL